MNHKTHSRPENPKKNGSKRNGFKDGDLDKKFITSFIKNQGDKELITIDMGWKPNNKMHNFSDNVYRYVKRLNLKKAYPEFIKPVLEKPRKTPPPKGRRGPVRKSYIDEQVLCFTCVDDYVDGKKHLWKCNNCGRKLITTKNSISQYRGCSVCGGPTQTDPITPFATNRRI